MKTIAIIFRAETGKSVNRRWDIVNQRADFLVLFLCDLSKKMRKQRTIVKFVQLTKLKVKISIDLFLSFIKWFACGHVIQFIRTVRISIFFHPLYNLLKMTMVDWSLHNKFLLLLPIVRPANGKFERLMKGRSWHFVAHSISSGVIITTTICC